MGRPSLLFPSLWSTVPAVAQRASGLHGVDHLFSVIDTVAESSHRLVGLVVAANCTYYRTRDGAVVDSGQSASPATVSFRQYPNVEPEVYPTARRGGISYTQY